MQDKGPLASLKPATQMSGTCTIKDQSNHLHFPVSNSLYLHTADVCILYVHCMYLCFLLFCVSCVESYLIWVHSIYPSNTLYNPFLALYCSLSFFMWCISDDCPLVYKTLFCVLSFKV